MPETTKILFIDNYDSFTFNLVQYFKELCCSVKVIRNDEMTVAEVRAQQPDMIVLSPGPCSPNEAGICLDVVAELAGKIPILGVCLGHQVIAQSFGGQVRRANKVMHGKVSTVQHWHNKMFTSMPEKFCVTRYHSLVVSAENLPEEFEVTASTINTDSQSAEIMAIAHKSLPLWGVQFHPESHLTQYGHQLLDNLLKLAANRNELV